jgi:hypothetical protein
MNDKYKNVKISEKHHDLLKNYCETKGLKIYKVIEKWIDEHCKPKKKDLYGD